MTAYWLAQGVGVLAFAIGITTFINRDERRFKLQLSLYSFIIGCHFFLMGAAPAGMSAVLNAFRTVISLRTRSLWVMSVFITLTLFLGLIKLHHPMELLPIIGTVASTWALFRCKGLTVPHRALRDVVLNRLLGQPQYLAGFDWRLANRREFPGDERAEHYSLLADAKARY